MGDKPDSHSNPSPQTGGSSNGAKLDAATQAKIKAAQDIGEAAFEENTKILKKVMFRGFRSVLVAVVGLLAFGYAMRRKAKMEELEAAKAKSTNDEDPTQRYLKEMDSLGFDVETLEDELAAEKRAKKQADLMKSR